MSRPVLHVDVAGAGSTGLVLLHPNPLDSSSWLFQVGYFSTWFRTLAIDLPGYGHSSPLRGPISMTELADLLWTAVDEHGVDRTIVAGVSIGASLALHMAAQQPERTVATIISGYGYGPDKPWAARRIEGYRRDGLSYRNEHLRDGFSPAFRASVMGRFVEDSAIARAGLVDLPSVIELFRAHGAPDPEALFETSCPTLLIMGSQDYAYQRATALHQRIEASELAVIEGAGHACNIEQPALWNELALDFLRRRTDVFGPDRASGPAGSS